jgi:hypothetical protein
MRHEQPPKNSREIRQRQSVRWRQTRSSGFRELCLACLLQESDDEFFPEKNPNRRRQGNVGTVRNFR